MSTKRAPLSVRIPLGNGLESFDRSKLIPIVTRLYIGSRRNANDFKSLKEANVTHIVVMAKECKNHFVEHFTYHNFDFEDIEGQKIDLHEIADLINELVRDNAVFVHCLEGISRSVTAVLAYLVKYRDMTLQVAYDMVLERRPIAAPNAGFLKQLCIFEIEIRGTCSLDVKVYGPLIRSAEGYHIT